MPPFACRALLALGLSAACLAAQAAPTLPPEDEMAALGARITAAFNERDARALAAMTDFDAFSGRVADALGDTLPTQQISSIRRGVIDAGPRTIETTMRRVSEGQARATLLRASRNPEGWDLLVRLALHDAEGASAGFDYVQFEVGDDDRIDDWTSETLAASASRQVSTVIAMMAGDPSLLSSLFGVRRIDEPLLAHFKRLRDAIAALDNPRAFAVLGDMPEPVRASRFWATYRVAIASNLDEATYRESLDYLASHHGDAPDLDFLLVDHAYYRKDFPRVIALLEAFEQRVVADATTSLLKCAAFAELGDFAAASRNCRRSVELEPAEEDAWWAMAGIAISAKDAALAIEALDGLEANTGHEFDPDAIVALKEYAWMAGTPAFKAWQQAARSPKPPKP